MVLVASFNGVDQFAQAPDSPSLRTVRTVFFHLMMPQDAKTDASNRFVSKEAADGTSVTFRVLGTSTSTSNVRARFDSAAGTALTAGDFTVVNRNWNLVLAEFDGGVAVRLRIIDPAGTETAYVTATTATGLFHGATPLHVGGLGAANSTIARMANLGIHDSLLTAAQISTIRSSGTPDFTCSGGFWPLRGDWNDKHQTNHLTATGATFVDDTTVTWTPASNPPVNVALTQANIVLTAATLSAGGGVAEPVVSDFAYPWDTLEKGTWLTEGATSPHEALDEPSPYDTTDFIVSATDPVSQWITVSLSDINQLPAGKDFRFVYGIRSAGVGDVAISIDLLHGSTLITSKRHTDVTEGWAHVDRILTAEEVAMVNAGATNLTARITADMITVGATATRAHVAYVRLATVDKPVAPTPSPTLSKSSPTLPITLGSAEGVVVGETYTATMTQTTAIGTSPVSAASAPVKVIGGGSAVPSIVTPPALPAATPQEGAQYTVTAGTWSVPTVEGQWEVANPPLAWHPHGTQPAMTVANLRAHTRAQYDDFFAYTEATDGMPAGMPAGARRVKVPDQIIHGWTQAGGTVSEGMGYALKLCAWMGNPALGSGVYDPNARSRFDGHWTYVKHFLNARGLMSWSIRHDGTVADTGAASDGDFDIAMGLILAHRLWGSGGAVNYGAAATSMCNAMLAHNFTPANYTGVGGPNVMMNGDAWGVDTNRYMPDYFRPAYFREFAKHTGNTRWNDIIAKNYPLAVGYFYNNFTGGVVPDGCTRAGLNNGVESYLCRYNAVRMGFGLVADFLWNGAGANSLASTMTARAATRARTLWTTGGNVRAVPYDLNLTTGEPYANNAGRGLIGPCALVDSTHATFAAELVTAIRGDAEASYFNKGIGTVALAFMSGVARPYNFTF